MSNGLKVFCSEAFPEGQEKIVQVLQEEREGKLAEVSQKIEMTTPYFVFFLTKEAYTFQERFKKRKRGKDWKIFFSRIAKELPF